ncbi:MAG: hypothetical protein LBC98_07855 [Prevotellaceae bacterium]|jgi:hypothetical protein|nr:hypothetical protein [Prevotellaceae bacterium]
MTDKKKITSIIKTLERTIGILENCKDTNEMSEATQRRIIELLNTSMLDLYFVKSTAVAQEEEQNVEEFSQKIMAADKPKSEVEEFFTSSKDIHLAPDVHEEPTVSGLHEIVEELDQHSEQPKIEQISEEQCEEKQTPEETYPAQAEQTSTEEYQAQTQYIDEKQSESYSEPQQKEESAPRVSEISPIEWDTSSELITAEPEEDLAVIEERKVLDDLRKQLEEERKRLEQELQNWQLEKMKREEEMLASQRLLASLAEEEQRRKALLEKQTVEASVKQTAPAVEAPRQMAPPAPAPATEQKKVLHEHFENDELKMQGITPIADLTKAIAINEKFQFIKELFGGDFDRYAGTIKALNNAGSLGSAISYIDSNFNWDKNNEATRRLIMLVRRRFMQ